MILSDFELERLYIQDGMRQREIAEMYGCTVSAVSMRMKKAGIECRKVHDYPTTENPRAAWVEIGKRRKGFKMPEETKKKLSDAKKTHKMGAKIIRCDGYVSIYYPDYQSSTKDGRVLEHIYVMEKEIGRRLKPEECVHHINHDKTDNRIENLRLMTRSEHTRLHNIERHSKRKELQL